MPVSVFDLFKVGIGPSSSHTVGPMKAAREFALGLQDAGLLRDCHRIKAELYGSLGATGAGHGSPKAIILGLEGETPESVDVASIADRVADARANGTLTLLGEQAVNFDYKTDLVMHRTEALPYHSNGMRFSAFDGKGNTLNSREFYSVGGGFVVDEDTAAHGDVIVEDPTELPHPFTTAAKLLEQCAVVFLDRPAALRNAACCFRSRAESTESGVSTSTMIRLFPLTPNTSGRRPPIVSG